MSIETDFHSAELQRTSTSLTTGCAAEGQPQTYRCPGETLPVSRAVHLGRLAAGWAGCRDCVWQQDTGDTHPLRPAEDANVTQHQSIRRTEFGVRGAYLNEIDRFKAAQLATIFSTQITNQTNAVHADASSENDDEDSVCAIPQVSLAIGYDGRHGSPDLFAGINSAVRQNGCHVVDAGRCTAASLLHVLRRDARVHGAILVTGSDGAAGDVGMDVFTHDQQPVPVPWQRFGVINRAAQRNRNRTAAACVADALAQIRSGSTDHSLAGIEAVQFEVSELILPDLTVSGQRLFRSVRQSGGYTSIPSEDSYRQWLQRWWPQMSDVAVTAVVADSVVADRLLWLASERSLNIQVRTTQSALTAETAAPAESGRKASVSLEIAEDDRFIIISSRHHGAYAADQLAAWINGAVHSGNSHVTAHAATDGSRILLADVALPHTGRQQELISDGLAIAGLVTQLLSGGKNRLPL